MNEAEAQHQPGDVRCPRCGADLSAEQDWCLRCGTAARTVIAPTPNWRLPVAVIALVVVLSGVALAWGLVALTDNDAEVRAATARPATTATVPPATTVPATPGAAPATTAPATTTPGAAPGTTAPDLGAAPPVTQP